MGHCATMAYFAMAKIYAMDMVIVSTREIHVPIRTTFVNLFALKRKKIAILLLELIAMMESIAME
jgi:uncharacterized protein YueI